MPPSLQGKMSAPLMLQAPPRQKSLLNLARWAWRSWATRSLAIGAVATVLDVLVLLLCVEVFGMMKPLGAAVGVSLGSTFTFFANKHFAFRDHRQDAAPQALKFAGATAVAMVIHATLVGVLSDRMNVPLVLAKLIADVLVFSAGQLLVLRFLVFPKHRPHIEDHSHAER